jgi:hypothetical protein
MRILAAAVFLAAALWLGPSLAADCVADQRLCLKQCDTAYPVQRDDMGHAGCLARCALDGASCEARRAVDETQATLDQTVKPWMEDQAGKWQRFLDGFRGRPAGPPRSTPERGTPEADPRGMPL